MKKLLAVLFLPAALALLFGCGAKDGLVSRVSEYKSAVYTAEADGAALEASYSEREYPYAMDGIAADMSGIFEVCAQLPDNTLTYSISFEAGGKSYGGEMNYDGVRRTFNYSEGIPAPAEQTYAQPAAYAAQDSVSEPTIDPFAYQPANNDFAAPAYADALAGVPSPLDAPAPQGD